MSQARPVDPRDMTMDEFVASLLADKERDELLAFVLADAEPDASEPVH